MSPQYGFVIDQTKCIGCHACTVACKAENEVPLGKFRTWVKYTEQGTFPKIRRHFTILRCNHCDAAPCIEICPVNALSKRPDAIVDLDRDLCIGCRACMQACPYDALYFNEDGGTAEKCHYCAHRTEMGLEPACVIVCPVQAIVAGDTSDPETPISRLIREKETSRRKLEKGTKPRVWYIDALPESLVPGTAAEPSAYLWSQRSPDDQPIPVVPGYEPTPDITTTLDVPHPPAWGWHVWLYLVTKNISAGAAMIAPFLGWLGVREGFARDYVAEIVALAFLAITNVLLVHDLGRPERFWRILFTPNTKSWLVKGAWVLTAFGIVTTAALGARWAGLAALADALRWVNLPAAVMASGYSAFLFAQCKGRDLWLEKGLFLGLTTRAAFCGALLAALSWPGALRSTLLVVTMAAVLIAFVREQRGSSGDAEIRARQRLGNVNMQPWRLLLLVAVLAGGLMGARIGSFEQIVGVLVLGWIVARERARIRTMRPWRILLLIAVLAGGLLGARIGRFDQVVAALLLAWIVAQERAWIRAGQAVPIS